MRISLVWRKMEQRYILVGVIPETDKSFIKANMPDCYFQPIALGDYEWDGLLNASYFE